MGLIAIGDSFLTGENSDPSKPGEPAFENSWATGTNPDVDSIYQRMVAKWPDTEGHVATGAYHGALAEVLPGQAESALATVPNPRLVIIETMDDDILCNEAGDAAHVPDFGKSVDRALQLITSAAPQAHVLIVAEPGRPASDFASLEADIEADPSWKAEMTGEGPCGFYDQSGKVRPDFMSFLTSVIEGYEAEQARVCAKYPACATDEGAMTHFVPQASLFTADHSDLNVAGQRQLAELAWPSAEKQAQSG
jgi:hypothetical protein